MPEFFRADLHCHSTCSDGSLNPAELVDLALDRGLQGLSITDHDTIAAYPAAFEAAAGTALTVLPGCEFSCRYQQEVVHVLGYAFDLSSEPLIAFCAAHRRRRLRRLERILQKLQGLGIDIPEQEIFEKSGGLHSVGRPHIAQALMRRGLVKNIQGGFNEYLGSGKPAFVPGEPFTVEETLEVIHAAKGLAVLAHPHIFPKRALLKSLLKLPFDGMECYYARQAPATERYFLKRAEDRELLITGGSDFHGDPKPFLPLGCSWTPQASFDILKEHYERHLP